MIELRHLRYFLAVAEEGHVTRAAERLGMQQPPLSQQIASLERQIGVRLFRRLPRGVALTEAGRTLLVQARPLLEQVDNAIAITQRTARGEEGRLAIGFTSPAAFHPLVTGTIRDLKERSPKLTLTLEEADTTRLMEAVRSERLDAAFVRTPVSIPAGLVVDHLLTERMFVAFPAGHPKLGGSVSLRDLADQAFIFPRQSASASYDGDGIRAACLAAGFEPMRAQEAARTVSMISLVAAGLGIAIVPESLAHMAVSGVVCVPLNDDAGLGMPLNLVRRDEDALGAVSLLLELVRERVGALDPRTREYPG